MTDAATLADYADAAREAARRGAAVLEEWRRRFSVREKARFDLVTDADLASQKAIQEYLAGRFPDHGFLGEEDKSPQARRSLQKTTLVKHRSDLTCDVRVPMAS